MEEIRLVQDWYADRMNPAAKAHRKWDSRSWFTPPGYETTLCDATYPKGRLKQVGSTWAHCRICEKKEVPDAQLS